MKEIDKSVLYDRVHEILIELGEMELAFDVLVAKRKRMELDYYLSKSKDENEYSSVLTDDRPNDASETRASSGEKDIQRELL
jgi:hypothetical protein